MRRSDWALVWSWLLFVLLIGPYLFSARDSLMVVTGIAVAVLLLWLTQRRVLPIIVPFVKEKIK
jgi:hypothetical protein